MAKAQIDLPQDMSDWIARKIVRGEYLDPGDYVRDLIRRDREAEQKRKRARVQELVDEGRASGSSGRTVEEIFDEAIAHAT